MLHNFQSLREYVEHFGGLIWWMAESFLPMSVLVTLFKL
jgi:hypothetical protein